MATTNEHWIYLENLRRSGIITTYGTLPLLMEKFGMEKQEASKVLDDWMRNYNADDY